jgi:hypothetical protein
MRNSNERKSKKRIAAIAILTVFLLGGGGAATYAYWTAGGTGIGSATTGTSAGITANQTSTITGIAPGVAAQTLSGNFNNGNAGPSYVTSVTVSISSVVEAPGAVTGYTCSSADYTLTGATMAVGANIPAGTAKGAWTGATIAFNNSTTQVQDACKNATVNFAYTIS